MKKNKRSASSCIKHVDKAVKHIIGAREEVTARLVGVGGTGQHFCFCGQPAHFYIVQVEDERAKAKAKT